MARADASHELPMREMKKHLAHFLKRKPGRRWKAFTRNESAARDTGVKPGMKCAHCMLKESIYCDSSWTTAADPSLISPNPPFLPGLSDFMSTTFCLSEWNCFVSKSLHHCGIISTVCTSSQNFTSETTNLWFSCDISILVLIWILTAFSKTLPGSIPVTILHNQAIIIPSVSYCNSHCNGSPEVTRL